MVEEVDRPISASPALRIIYAYARVFQEAVTSLDGYDVEAYDLSDGDEAYWNLLRQLWLSGDDFLIVEQDIVVPSGAIERLAACPREWCAVPYRLGSVWGCWHGLTRYRGTLTRSLPGLPDEIRNRHWSSLDSAWINHLRKAGYPEAHWHWPGAVHLKVGNDPFTGNSFLHCRCGAALSDDDMIGGPDHAACHRCGRPLSATIVEQTPTDVTL